MRHPIEATTDPTELRILIAEICRGFVERFPLGSFPDDPRPCPTDAPPGRGSRDRYVHCPSCEKPIPAWRDLRCAVCYGCNIWYQEGV